MSRSTHDLVRIVVWRSLAADSEISMPFRESFNLIAGFSFLLAVAFSLAGTSAEAQVTKPFKISGEGIGPMGLPLPGQAPRPHGIVGEATHLGRHAGLGSVQTDSAQFNADGTITGEFGSGSPFVFVGANGDELACHYGRTEFGAEEPGTFELTILDFTPAGIPIVEAVFVAEFVPQPELCTGKFAGISGSWIMIARSEPFVLGSSDPLGYEWVGEGELTFQKPTP